MDPVDALVLRSVEMLYDACMPLVVDQMKRAIPQLRYQCEKCAQQAIGATRCGVKCENTVLIEPRAPFVCADAAVTQ